MTEETFHTSGMPQPADLVIKARWVIPVRPHGQVLEDAAVVINDGRIVDVLRSTELSARYQAAQTITLNDHALVPGLINLHTHAGMTLMRGLADDLPLMQWLNEHIWPAEKKVISERFVRDSTFLGCAEMLSGGVTCFNEMYFYPESAAEAVMQAGIRANLGLIVLEFPTSYAHDADDYLQKGLNIRDTWRGHDLLSASLAPHAPYTISDETFAKVLTYADQLGIGIHTHVHETQDEISQSTAQHGVRPLQRLANLGLLGPNMVAAHCVHMQPEEMSLLAEYGCHVAHCPTSNLKLASGIAPITELLTTGVNVGIGTDGAASNNRLDMFSEMRLAALLAKGASGDAAVLPASQALEMATLGGAKALCMEEKIGSIEIGKMADLVAVRIADPEVLPCFDPISHLVYVSEREHVSHVWVAGELQYQKLAGQTGVYANIEPTELKEIIEEWQPILNQYKV